MSAKREWVDRSPTPRLGRLVAGNRGQSMAKCSRRAFCGVLTGGLISQRAAAAPFVPVRDPQVVAFAPGGTMVATGCSGLSDGNFPPRPHPNVRKSAVVALWDVATRKRMARFETFGDFRKLAFSPNGKQLAAGRLFATSDGVELDEVRIWDLATLQLVQVLDRCHAFDFSPDGEQLAVLSRSRCVLYGVADWSKQAEVKPLGGALAVAYSAAGDSLVGIVPAAGGYTLRKCSRSANSEVASTQPLQQPFYTLAVSADGSRLASGHGSGELLVWDAEGLGLQLRLRTGFRGITHPFFSPDGQILAAGCQETGDVAMWSLISRQEIARHTFAQGALRTYYSRASEAVIRPELDPTRFCFSPDGNAFLAGCYGGILRAARGGQELARFGE